MWKGCWLAAFAGALPLWSIACGDGKLKYDDFDLSCDVDSDCVVVEELGFCCSCEEVAINRDELADYEEAAGCDSCDFNCPPASSPRCLAGMCEAKPDLLCAPGGQYLCENEACPTGNGSMRCMENGFGYEDCLCD